MSLDAVLSRLGSIQASIDGLAGATTIGTTADAVGGIMTSSDADNGSTAFASLLGSTASSGLDGTSATTSSTDAANTDTANGVTGSQILAEAEKYLGVPYKLGGESTSGIDCSGLVQLSLKNLGISVPRGVIGQASVGTAVSSLAQAQPGDLIVLKGDSHVVVYAGNGMVVHAPYPGRTVSLQKEWFTDADVATIRRVTSSGSTT